MNAPLNKPFYFRPLKVPSGWVIEIHDLALKPMGIMSYEGKPVCKETRFEAETYARAHSLRPLQEWNP